MLEAFKAVAEEQGKIFVNLSQSVRKYPSPYLE